MPVDKARREAGGDLHEGSKPRSAQVEAWICLCTIQCFCDRAATLLVSSHLQRAMCALKRCLNLA